MNNLALTDPSRKETTKCKEKPTKLYWELITGCRVESVLFHLQSPRSPRRWAFRNRRQHTRNQSRLPSSVY
jgi:hypothetical protein